MSQDKKAELTIPQFGELPALTLDMTKIHIGEERLHEAQVVNQMTYSELEYTFNEGYREAKKSLSQVGFQLTRAKKALRKAKSTALLDDYPEFLKEKGMKDSAQIRDAYLERIKDYTDAQDRIDMLMAISTLLESKIEVFVNTCRYMKKQMDIELQSGVNSNKYKR
jgi:hypothetical protein